MRSLGSYTYIRTCSSEMFAHQIRTNLHQSSDNFTSDRTCWKGSKEIQSAAKDLPKDIHKFSHVMNYKNSSQRHRDVVAKDRLPTGTYYCCGGK